MGVQTPLQVGVDHGRVRAAAAASGTMSRRRAGVRRSSPSAVRRGRVTRFVIVLFRVPAIFLFKITLSKLSEVSTF
jgi:hypothetical protein